MKKIDFTRREIAGLVSVIIPTRRGERFIGAALESIARQSYHQWEVIVIEDGSQGETESIVRGFADDHPTKRVEYRRSRVSHGAAHTRNTAFTLAAGEFIAFLDCDDRWLPDHLSSCVDALNESRDDIAYSAAVMCEDGTDHVLGVWGPTHHEVAELPQSLFGRSFVTPSATVVRRGVVADVGPWNTSCQYCEDADFFLRAAELGKKFCCIGGIHCLYRKNHQGATTQRIAGTIEENAFIASWYIGMAKTRRGRCTRMVSGNFAMAARMHACNDETADPSAKRSRAAPLYVAAWRQRPKRIGYLVRAAYHALVHGYSRNPKLPTRPKPSRNALIVEVPQPVVA